MSDRNKMQEIEVVIIMLKKKQGTEEWVLSHHTPLHMFWERKTRIHTFPNYLYLSSHSFQLLPSIAEHGGALPHHRSLLNLSDYLVLSQGFFHTTTITNWSSRCKSFGTEADFKTPFLYFNSFL